MERNSAKVCRSLTTREFILNKKATGLLEGYHGNGKKGLQEIYRKQNVHETLVDLMNIDERRAFEAAAVLKKLLVHKDDLLPDVSKIIAAEAKAAMEIPVPAVRAEGPKDWHLDDGSEVYKINLEAPATCSCSQHLMFRIPCRHIIRAFLESRSPFIEEQHVNARWLLEKHPLKNPALCSMLPGSDPISLSLAQLIQRSFQ